MGVEKKTEVELEITIFQVFQAKTKPNIALQPTAYSVRYAPAFGSG